MPILSPGTSPNQVPFLLHELRSLRLGSRLGNAVSVRELGGEVLGGDVESRDAGENAEGESS